MTALRQSDDLDVMSRSVTLVRCRNGVFEFATTITEKREWLADRRVDDNVCAAWTGAYKTELFEVP